LGGERGGDRRSLQKREGNGGRDGTCQMCGGGENEREKGGLPYFQGNSMSGGEWKNPAGRVENRGWQPPSNGSGVKKKVYDHEY